MQPAAARRALRYAAGVPRPEPVEGSRRTVEADRPSKTVRMGEPVKAVRPSKTVRGEVSNRLPETPDCDVRQRAAARRALRSAAGVPGPEPVEGSGRTG